MSRQVKVEERLDFSRGSAKLKANVYGPAMAAMTTFSDYFTDDTLSTDKWASSVPGTSDTIAFNAQQGGACRITTGTADNDSSMIATPLIFSGTKGAICEARITITDVSGTGLFVGFSDAASESNNSIAIHYPADSLTTVATDAAGFVIDADHSTSSIMAASVMNGSDTTPIDLGVDWADGETKNLRVILSGTTAVFYLDAQTATATIASSVTAATLLCFTVQAITRDNDGANTVDIHRVHVWQDE